MSQTYTYYNSKLESKTITQAQLNSLNENAVRKLYIGSDCIYGKVPVLAFEFQDMQIDTPYCDHGGHMDKVNPKEFYHLSDAQLAMFCKKEFSEEIIDQIRSTYNI